MKFLSKLRQFTAALLTLCLVAGDVSVAFAKAQTAPIHSAQIIYGGQNRTVSVLPGKSRRDMRVQIDSGNGTDMVKARIRRGNDRVFRSLIEEGGTIRVDGQTVKITPNGNGGISFLSDNGKSGEIATPQNAIAIAIVIIVIVVVIVPMVRKAAAEIESSGGSASVEVGEDGDEES